MFSTLLVKEIRVHLMTFRFGAILLSTFLLITLSSWILSIDYERRMDAYNASADTYAQEARDVRIPSLIRPVLYFPPSPLSILVQGETKHLGNAVDIELWTVPSEASDSLTDNMLLSAYPSFDLMSIIILVISAFGVLLTYDAVSGEREIGTLKLLCSGSVKRSTIFLAKLAAAVIVLAFPRIISMISSLLVMIMVHGISISAQMWLAIVMIIITGLIYGSFFVALGLLTSSLMRRSSGSLVLSLLVWAILVLFLPNTAVSVAGASISLAKPTEIDDFALQTEYEIEQNQPDFTVGLDNMNAWGSTGSMTSWFYFASPDSFIYTERFINHMEPLYDRRADQIWELVKKHDQYKQKQRDLGFLLASPSPVTHFRNALNSLAQTDHATYDSFMEDTRRFRSAMLADFQGRGYFSNNTNEFVSQFTKEQVNDGLWP